MVMIDRETTRGEDENVSTGLSNDIVTEPSANTERHVSAALQDVHPLREEGGRGEAEA